MLSSQDVLNFFLAIGYFLFGISSNTVGLSEDVSTAYDDLLPLFQEEDSTQAFYNVAFNKLAEETPNQNDVETMFNAFVNETDTSYFSDHGFISYKNQTGTVVHDKRTKANTASQVYGRFEQRGKTGDYWSIGLNRMIYDDHSVGMVFYSKMGYNIEGSGINWQGIIKTSLIDFTTNKLFVLMNSHVGATKGYAKFLKENAIESSVSNIGAYSDRGRLNKSNSTVFEQLDINTIASLRTNLESLMGRSGILSSVDLDTTILQDGTFDASGKGSFIHARSISTVEVNFKGASTFDVSDPLGEYSLGHFFTMMFLGRGSFIN